MNLPRLKAFLTKHEGRKSTVYDDKTGEPIVSGSTIFGHPTIGVGRNLSGKGLSDKEIDYLLYNDIDDAWADLMSIFPTFSEFSESRQFALVSLMFMGKKAFLTFWKMISAINQGDWERAANEVIDSRYAVQVGKRAIEIAGMIRKGGD